MFQKEQDKIKLTKTLTLRTLPPQGRKRQTSEMAFNRFMHPRNVFKQNPPNFSELADRYPEFRQHCAVSFSGKVNVNFKEAGAVRALARVLLMEYFGLDVDIPADSLVPRIPQRFNYILWIEDMLTDNKTNLKHGSLSPAKGIDIGTGASCVYPLLGAKHCGWSFVATDKDPEAVAFARKNVEKNQLGENIKIIQVPDKSAICEALSVDSFDENFDFCMCNPPFYDSTELADHEGGYLRCCSFSGDCEKEKRSDKKPRRGPHSVTVAKQSEVCSEGGEYVFVSKIIEDSVKLKNKISIYTSMIGKKANLSPLKEKLRSAGVTAMSHTVFCQGKTQRWALAWTFDCDIILKKGDSIKTKKPTCYSFDIPIVVTDDNFEAAVFRVLNYFNRIKIGCERSESSATFCALRCEAAANTWSNQRRKRRAKVCIGSIAVKEKQTRLEELDDSNEEKRKDSVEIATFPNHSTDTSSVETEPDEKPNRDVHKQRDMTFLKLRDTV